MPYNALESLDAAGVALRAWGHTLEEMFLAASDAMMHVMGADADAPTPQEKRVFKRCEASMELLLCTFLQTFIDYKNDQCLLMRAAEVHITQEHGNFCVSALVEGAAWLPDVDHLTTDVQGVDLSRMQIVEMSDAWATTFVLEV